MRRIREGKIDMLRNIFFHLKAEHHSDFNGVSGSNGGREGCTFPLRRWFITLCRPHQQIIVKRVPHSLQGAAHRRLAQQQPLGGTRYVAFLGKHREHNQEIQVGLMYALYA
jgi:hypothetical protein